MVRVALTGGVASGKSAAAALFRALGAAVSHSDDVARALMQPGELVYERIVSRFGQRVVLESGFLDRAALARVGFEHGWLEELNAIVHPAVIAAQADWMDAVAAADPLAVAMVESALVLETRYSADGPTNDQAPWRSRFDRIVVVTAPLAARQERYVRRVGGSNRAEVIADFDRRCAAQWTDAQRTAFADFVLRNDGSLADLEGVVERVYRALRAESEELASAAM